MTAKSHQQQSSLQLRCITAAIGIPVLWWLIMHANIRSFAICLALISVFAAKEGCHLCFKQPVNRLIWLIIWLFGTMLFLHGDKWLTHHHWFLLGWVLIWQLATVFVWLYPAKQLITLTNTWRSIFIGFALIPFAWMVLHIEMHSRAWLLFCLLLTWGGDSAAYFVGKSYGKRYLSPWLSPKKTWEGFLGQCFGCGLILAWAGPYLFPDQHLHGWRVLLITTAVSAFTSLVGDLFFSWQKRLMQVKDTGGILPGHGGLLDRIDSLLGLLPWFYLAVFWF